MKYLKDMTHEEKLALGNSLRNATEPVLLEGFGCIIVVSDGQNLFLSGVRIDYRDCVGLLGFASAVLTSEGESEGTLHQEGRLN